MEIDESFGESDTRLSTISVGKRKNAQVERISSEPVNFECNQNRSLLESNVHVTQPTNTQQNTIFLESRIPMRNEYSKISNDMIESEKPNSTNSKGTTNKSSKIASSQELNNKHQGALAFTIDFNDKEFDTVKYQNLFERYNARHKRNLSMSKSLNTSMSSNSICKQKITSTHSEGYFSSEDDTKRKSEKLSEKMKLSGSQCFPRSKSNSKILKLEGQTLTSQIESMSEDFVSQTRISHQNHSFESDLAVEPQLTTQKSITMNDLSNIQTNNHDDNNEKFYTKNIEHLNHIRKEQIIEQSVNDLTEKVNNADYGLTKYNSSILSSTQECDLSSISCSVDINSDEGNNTNLDVFNVSTVNADSEEDDDAASETGTYTVLKDYTDEEKARMDIDKVFSVGVLQEEEIDEDYVHNFKMCVSRDSNTWISEWATQVAEHNSLPASVKSSGMSQTPPMSPSKIPSPIYSRSQRTVHSRHEHSDSSIDAESYIRIKERVGSISNQYTLIDSGGESDDDTSNSYNTPPHSSQRTPVHGSSMHRHSLSESLFKKMSFSENRKNVQKYMSSSNENTATELLKSPSKIISPRHHLGRRSSSLDRRDYTSDTTESNTSRKNSNNYYNENDYKHTNSPVLNRLKPSLPKLSISPLTRRKTSTIKTSNSPVLDDNPKNLARSSSQTKANIGYYTCVENSPYMLKKSHSTTNYDTTIDNTEISARRMRNSPSFSRNHIQRSSSNTSIRNTRTPNAFSRRSYNSIDNGKTSRPKLIMSDSSSETGELQSTSTAIPASSGIKFNRTLSIRRARLTCESDTTPHTTPEERRKTAPTDTKSSPSNKQSNYYRPRTSSVGPHYKETFKKPELPKSNTGTPISRTDSGRFSMRTPKTFNSTPQRNNQKINKDNKNSVRSNSALTSKEVEFQNWKRRKSYDPMKAAAEGRKKLLDESRKHTSTEETCGTHDNSVLRSASFHGTRDVLSLANDWSDNEMNLYCDDDDNKHPPPCSPQLDSDSDLETSGYLKTTENVMSAMSARMSVQRSLLIDSDVDSDENTSQSLHETTPKAVVQVSDTESSDDRHRPSHTTGFNHNYNESFSSRKSRLEVSLVKTPLHNINKGKVSSQNPRGKSETVTSISRTDSGRFSMKSTSRTPNNGSRIKVKETRKPSTPSTKEVEMQNWKRRKSYDPMKAALEGKKKASLAKKPLDFNYSPSQVARSQSFHGSVRFATTDYSDQELNVSEDESQFY